MRMKTICRILFTVALIAGISQRGGASSEPDARAVQLLGQLSTAIRTMGGYGVSFEVLAGEHAVQGWYTVSGEQYYMNLGDAEVYCDGKVRYEIDNAKKEVLIDRVNTASRNILDNPAHAFDFIGTQYVPSLASAANGRAVILLAPSAERISGVGDVTLTLDTQTKLPVSLAYDFNGERIEVQVRSFRAETQAPRAFSRDAYETYEFIDFR